MSARPANPRPEVEGLPAPTYLPTWREDRPAFDPVRWQLAWDAYTYRNVASEHAYQLAELEASQCEWRRRLRAIRESERRHQLAGRAA